MQVPALAFVANFILAAFFAYLLGRLYVRCGSSLSNRAGFARNFMLLSLTTMLVISIVKSSLALSLGLVGALSIVRFRAAIKEPEELVYLFLSLAVGLGFGADQGMITSIAFIVVSSIILLRRRFQGSDATQNLFLTLSSRQANRVSLDKMAAVLGEHSAGANLTRFDETANSVEASFLVEFEDFAQLNRAKAALQALDPGLGISFIDARGVA